MWIILTVLKPITLAEGGFKRTEIQGITLSCYTECTNVFDGTQNDNGCRQNE